MLIGLAVFMFRFQKDFLGHYRTELLEQRSSHKSEIDEMKLAHAEEVASVRERVAALEALNKKYDERAVEMRGEILACAREREAMRVAMHANGIPWNPEDWR